MLQYRSHPGMLMVCTPPPVAFTYMGTSWREVHRQGRAVGHRASAPGLGVVHLRAPRHMAAWLRASQGLATKPSGQFKGGEQAGLEGALSQPQWDTQRTWAT